MSNSIATPYVSASKFSQFHYYLHRATLERAQDNLGTGTLASAARFSVGLVASLPIEVIKPWAQHGIPQDEIDLLLECRQRKQLEELSRASMETSTPQRPEETFVEKAVKNSPVGSPLVGELVEPSMWSDVELCGDETDFIDFTHPDYEEPSMWENTQVEWAKVPLKKAKKKQPGFASGVVAERLAAALLLLQTLIPDPIAFEKHIYFIDFDAEPFHLANCLEANCLHWLERFDIEQQE